MLAVSSGQLVELQARVLRCAELGTRFGFDTETYGPSIKTLKGGQGPDPYAARLVGYSLCFPVNGPNNTAYEAFYVPVAHYDVPAPGGWDVLLSTIVRNRDAKVWAHNWKYDAQVCVNHGLYPICKMYDSQVTAWMAGWRLPGKKGLKLKPLAEERLGVAVQEYNDAMGGKEDIREVGASRIGEYAAADAKYTLALGEMAWAALSEEEQQQYETLEAPMVHVLRHMEAAGVAIDRDYLNDAHKTCERLTEQYAKEFRELTKTKVILPLPQRVQKLDEDGEPAFFKNGNPKMHTVDVPTEVTKGCDVSSTKAINRWLFEELKWWPTKRHPKTPGGLYSTKEEHIAPYRTLGGDAAKAVELRLAHQHVSKLMTTYTQSLTHLADQYQDKRLHSSFHQTGTDTQRLSSTTPNLQNIPRDKPAGGLPYIKEALVARKGFVFVIADYSQIELRIMAHLSRDPAMLRIYENGEDIHANTMEGLGLARPAAKIVNFSTIYRIQPKSLMTKLNNFGIECDYARAKRIIDGFYKTYPGVAEYHEKAIAYVEKYGYAKCVTGFRRRLNYDQQDKSGQSLRWAVENQAINTPIQASAGGIMKIAMRDLFKKWWANKTLGRVSNIIGQVHDEVIVEVVEAEAEQTLAEVKSVLEAAFTLRVPLVVEGGIGRTWAEAK